jgi:Domain of unknown function (DUF1937)
LIYLAVPYTHDDAHVRRRRFDAACRATALLMERQQAVFSPLTHFHPLEVHMTAEHDHGWWMRACMPFIKACDRMLILRIPGWDTSKGVAIERQIFERRGAPVDFMDPQ